jgi:FixJ family two-component response regulator
VRATEMGTAVPETPLIASVDDDESVCEAIKGLLEALGLNAEAYSSAEEFLLIGKLDRTACLITDVAMRGMSGFQLMERLAALGYRIPTIVVTGYAIERSRVEAFNAGAVCFLPKPVAMTELRICIRSALELGGVKHSPKNP